MILVTGGTGLVGSHLLYQLVSNNETVRAIYRQKEKLDIVKEVFSYYSENTETLFNRIEWVAADITEVTSLIPLFKDITHVYHCAALVSFAPNKYHQLRKVNIEGTANVVNLCIANGVKKLCYVSSIATIGSEPKNTNLITERTHWNPEDDNNVYAITKYGAEIEVWRGTQEGLNAVIVNPGIIIGPGFWNGDGSGSIFKKIHKGLPFYTHGITGYVGVWDVVNAMHTLMKSGIVNDNYILVSENLSFNEFQIKVANCLSVSPAKKEASTFILEMAWRLDWLQHTLLRTPRRFTKQMARSARTETRYSTDKITSALDFKFSDIETDIARTSKFYRLHL